MSGGTPQVTNASAFRHRSLGKMVIFFIITLGFYGLWWMHQVNKQVAAGTDENFSPLMRTIGLLIPIINLYFLWKFSMSSEAVVDQMASWSTMRRHLVDCLDAEKEPRTAGTDWERESVDIARRQLVEKVNDALSSYETKGEIAGATGADVSVQVQLSCPECPTRRSLTDAIAVGYVCRDHLGNIRGTE